MDLALELGMTVGELSHRMTERELIRWQKYASKKMLPARRVEFYMAQVALMIGRTMGGNSQATLHDYLLDIPDDTPMTDEELDELKADIGFNPQNLH